MYDVILGKVAPNVLEECKSFYLLSTALKMTYTVHNCKLLMEKTMMFMFPKCKFIL